MNFDIKMKKFSSMWLYLCTHYGIPKQNEPLEFPFDSAQSGWNGSGVATSADASQQ
jgi:hypothetical protein